MNLNHLLLTELDDEAAKTRTTLERVPTNPAWAPHEKSMPLGRLAAHVAQLPDIAVSILTLPELNFGTTRWTPLPFESAAQLAAAFDERIAKARAALTAASESAWSQPWKLAFNDRVIFSGSRFLAYRSMFLNHLVHHRAQLGVYLRLNGQPVPAIYGPSADEPIF